MSQNLASIIADLQSDKVKLRQDALILMDEALANAATAERLSRSSKSWLAVFHALFVAVAFEKTNCTKKGIHKATSISISRLEKAGSVVRNATERNVAQLPYKVVRSLLEHLMNTMVDKSRDCLLAPLSLNYIKSIVVICSYSPHLDHLDPDLWISLVSLAFAVILEDSMAPPRGFAGDNFDGESNNIDMDVDELYENAGSHDEDGSTGSKRRRPKSIPPDPSRGSRSKSPVEAGRTMSQEQIEFMGLLVVLLRSPHAPFLQPGIAQNILNRIHRFFVMYPTWSIAHTNAVVSINVVFSQLELNMVKVVTSFALKMWSPLLSYWNGKEKRDKVVREELVVAMASSFALLTVTSVAEVPANRVPELVDEVYQCLQDDIDRSMFEGLPLDALRLHLHRSNDEKSVFDAITFRSGYKFDPPQVLSWVILELHADSARALHVYSERYESNAGRKRRRRISPLIDLLQCVGKDTVSAKRRSDNLQVLLFVIDRHWADLHETLQQEISTTLLSLLAHDDLTLQSWTFLCLAAIAAAPGTVNDDTIDWDAIWSQAVHRTNVLGVARAASHTAHVLLASQRLPIHRVLAEIEGFAANLLIQGPTFPFDTVCAFICDCLTIASQDMRLYRLQLPDKVIGWLSQSWTMVGLDLRHQLPPQAISDILSLLEVTCGLSKPSQVSLRYPLPDSVLTDAIIERHDTAPHRDYLLHSRLQPFRSPKASPLGDISIDTGTSNTSPAAPNARETKISALLLKSLDLLCEEWKEVEDVPVDATPEKVRRSFDAAVIALYFEASLVHNGTLSDRRVIQAACKLVARSSSSLKLTKWKPNERAMMLMGLEPLISDGDPRHEDDPWDLMLRPDKSSGVRRGALFKLSSDIDTNKPRSSSARKVLQSVLWKSADVQDTFEAVMVDLRKTLQVLTASTQVSTGTGEEEDDDFSHIQVAHSTPSTSRAHGRSNKLCIQLCIAFLSVAPILQSGTYNATHDKQLVTLLLKCDSPAFLALAPEFFQAVRNKQLYLSLRTAEMFMDRLEEVLSKSYSSARSVGTTTLAIQFLHSTSHIWMQASAAESQLSKGVRLLHDWLSNMVLEGKMASWRVRDRLICYLDHYLTIDPRETFWSLSLDEPEDGQEAMQRDESRLPSSILPRLADDEDVRVRFRVAVANGRLLRTAEVTGVNAMDIYTRVRKSLTVFLDQTEHMYTRFIHLGNAMIVSSEVRRGPYWHLLETCLHQSSYTTAVEEVLSAVAVRLGLVDLRSLFEAYASQLVTSVMHSGQDFFRFPPSLLGYDSRRQFGHATFALLAPMVFVTTVSDSPAVAQARDKTFKDHCEKAWRSVQEGLSECFSDIVGITILNSIDKRVAGKVVSLEIQRLSKACSVDIDPGLFLRRHLDRVVFSIVRSTNDIDHSWSGEIAAALKNDAQSERAAATFLALNVYRKSEEFKAHYPNTPAFSTSTICWSLKWLDDEVHDVFTSPVVYHVIHQLFAAIGESPLVNEQMRLLNALTIWISINTASFKDLTLLRTLLRGAVLLLSQADLARAAQGIIGWVFHTYISLGVLEATFPDLLGRIAKITYDYSRDAEDPMLNALGDELINWLEIQAGTLSDKELIKPQILSALPLWPRQPSGSLARFVREIDQSQPLSDILQNQHVTSGKLRLARRLRDLTNAGTYTREQFCREDFWYLKNCIPHHGEIHSQDIDAFVELLFKHSAQIHPLEADLVAANSPSALHVQESQALRSGSKTSASPMRTIILFLLNILSTETAVEIHRAYKTLRLLFALPVTDAELRDTRPWPKPYRDEISYLRLCPLSPMAASQRSLEEFATSEILRTKNFQCWICEVTALLSDVLSGVNLFFAQLSPSVRSDPSIASRMLPVLVHCVLTTDRKDARSILSRYFSSILLEETVSPERCQSIVDTVLHLRNFNPTLSEDPLAYDKWLEIDFRLLSRGAMSCGAYTTALLFLELAADYAPSPNDADAATENILYDIYSHIEEPDGFYAIKSNDVRGFLTRRFHHEDQWDMAFKFHGADFAAGLHDSRGAEGIYRSLHSNGFDKLAMAVLQSSTTEVVGTTPASSQLGYELAWRTQMWDLPESRGGEQAGSALYVALRAIHRNRDQQTVDALLRTALHVEMQHLRSTGNEDIVGIRSRVKTLLCLGEIRKWRCATTQHKLAIGEVSPGAWKDFVSISSEFDFSTLESIITTRMSLLLSIKQREQREQIGDLESPLTSGLKGLEQQCLLRLSKAARLSDHHQTALNASIHAQRLQRRPPFDVIQEFAHVLWVLKEHKPAVEYLRGLVVGAGAPLADAHEATKSALVLSRLGTWSAEACLQKPTDIREQYFSRAVDLLIGDGSQELDEPVDPAFAVVFHQYALFAEEQYHAILASPEVSRLKVYMERKRQEIEQIKEMSESNLLHNADYHQRRAEAIHAEDKALFSVHTEARTTFLVQAIEMYSRCLQSSDEFDDSAVIRLCSLWFANFGVMDIQHGFGRAFSRVASRKFVFLAHQLSARLSQADMCSSVVSEAQKHLQSLLIRMCNEHPFHSLYQVWALQQGAPDMEAGRRQSGRGGPPSVHSGRARAAHDILNICRQHASNIRGRVESVELLCRSYLEWAKYPLKPLKGDKKGSKDFNNAKVPRVALRELENIQVPVTTAHTPLDPTMRYDNIVTIVRYSPEFSTAGGQNLPKISNCIGSDGRKYKQLFKGEGGDDLRQDAVMEQVFELVNIVLKRDRQTRKRQLGVRCYKVIPLAPQAGLLEFVDKTMPLSDWLPQAHSRYHPMDMTSDECKSNLIRFRKLCTNKEGVLNTEKMLDLFLDMMRQFQPVFRHFFTERNKLPMAWFSTRLNYARSAATTSIVGHVLGLGDRHVSNILIDTHTGELVHIDLGIAFDQGKLLKVPELVPFRLTADMVDGLGTAGTEGVFRRCAEETLRVLRAESGVITTVLEVFRHDPLHSWTASAIRIKRMQAPSETSTVTVNTTGFGVGIDMTSDAADESADRALTSVRRKLDQSLSVEYTVNELITTATDPTNICQLFFGWSPHL